MYGRSRPAALRHLYRARDHQHDRTKEVGGVAEEVACSEAHDGGPSNHGPVLNTALALRSGGGRRPTCILIKLFCNTVVVAVAVVPVVIVLLLLLLRLLL